MKMWKDKDFDGFRVIPVKFTAESSAQHWLFYRQHAVREKSISKPSERTLFIVNVPPYCTEDSFHHVFSAYGPVTSVFMHQKPTGKVEAVEDSQFFKSYCPIKLWKQDLVEVELEVDQGFMERQRSACNRDVTLQSQAIEFVVSLKEFEQEEENIMLHHDEPLIPFNQGFKVAYIVFETTAGLQKALKMNKSGRPLILSTEEMPITCGLQKWCKEYNQRIPDTDVLQKDIDSFMEGFDLKSEEKAKQEKDALEADEEGWITVTKRGRKPGFARKESVQNKIMGKEREKRSKKELLNFYRFQIRETKMKHLVSLRKKFEEDKKKLAFLKQSRKFKPF